MQTGMKYVYLGNTGLKVSRIAFGNWLNSNDQAAKDEMVKMVKKAWDSGINFFDTAEVYGDGEAERQFAVALKNLNVGRDQYVLSTKIFWGPTRTTNPNDIGLSRKHIVEGLKNCLERLEHDYVDIVFAHRFDQETPLEETCRAFDWVIKQGLATYWGTSEWTAANIFEAFAICNKYNLIPPIADQCQYNMLERQNVDKEYGRLFDHYKYGTTVWSPLAGGLLTGKYNDGIPDDSRFKKEEKMFQEQIKKVDTLSGMLKKLGEIAKKLDITQAQLALAWVIYNKDVSTAIVGASKVSQLDDTLKAISIVDKLTPEVLEEIEEVLQTRPQPYKDYRIYKDMPHRR